VDAVGVLAGERDGRGRGGLVVLVLGVPHRAQCLVPVGFQAVGDQPVAGVDGQVAAAGEVGAVPGAFDVVTAQQVGVFGPGLQFGLHTERDLERERGEGVEQQSPDRGVHAGAGDEQAAARCTVDAFAHVLVVGHLDAVARVVAHAHPPPAAGADRQALEQRRAFPCRALVPLAAVRLGVTQQCGLVGLVLFEADISRVRVPDEREPLLARHGDHGLLAGGRVAGFAALPVDERAGIARVVQGAQHPGPSGRKGMPLDREPTPPASKNAPVLGPAQVVPPRA
jgi:hypothetical protein